VLRAPIWAFEHNKRKLKLPFHLMTLSSVYNNKRKLVRICVNGDVVAPPSRNWWCSSSPTQTQRLSVVAKAPVPSITDVTPGVIPPAGFMEKPDLIGPSKEVLAILKRLQPFSGTLKTVPPLGEVTRAAVVEDNSKIIWEYACTQYTKLFLDSSSAKPAFLDVSKYGGKAAIDEYTVALQKLPKILARGKSRGFMDAVTIRVQEKRDIDQQLPPIGITTDEAQLIKERLREVKAGLAYSAKTTQSASYVFGISPAQKSFDREKFQQWVDARSKGLVGIVRMTIADLPLGYASEAILDFELDPTNVVCRRNIEEKLVSLQTEALQEWRQSKEAFDLSSFLGQY